MISAMSDCIISKRLGFIQTETSTKISLHRNDPVFLTFGNVRDSLEGRGKIWSIFIGRRAIMNKKNRPATGAEAPAAPPLGHQGDLGAAGTFSLIP